MMRFQQNIFKGLNLVIVIGILLISGITIGGLFPDLDWKLAWYSNPRPQLIVLSILAALWFIRSKNRIMMSLTLFVLSLNLVVILPIFVKPAVSNLDSSPPLSIAHLNTNLGRAMLSELDDIDVDLLLLQEVTPSLDKKLQNLFPSYDLVTSHPLTNSHGSAVMVHKNSEVEIIQSEIIHLPAKSKRPLISVQVKVGDQFLQLLNLHLTRPQRTRTDRYQKVELNAVSNWSLDIQKETDNEVLIIGDFNVTPWAQRFHQLLSNGHLQDSLAGYGLQNTWPSTIPLIFGIPIDHAVHSDGLVTLNRSVKVVSGTDHALLQVDMGFEQS